MAYPIAFETLAASLAVVTAVAFPEFGARSVAEVARAFEGVARRRGASVVVCGIFALAIRAALANRSFPYRRRPFRTTSAISSPPIPSPMVD